MAAGPDVSGSGRGDGAHGPSAQMPAGCTSRPASRCGTAQGAEEEAPHRTWLYVVVWYGPGGVGCGERFKRRREAGGAAGEHSFRRSAVAEWRGEGGMNMHCKHC